MYGSGTDSIVAYDVDTGDQLWTVDTDGGTTAAPTIDTAACTSGLGSTPFTPSISWRAPNSGLSTSPEKCVGLQPSRTIASSSAR
ncbi:PQQ-binding-like beta-propeller repeat protein [Halolamina sp. R1-12]|nr:PQQ-binding-like beta-propeller repeat protein [Halolamina sp. R1-12]